MNNTIVASFFHKHWNVTCHRCIIHTLMSVYWMLSSTNRHTPALLIFKLKTCSLQSLYTVYSMHVYSYFTSSLSDIHTPTPTHTCRTSWPVTVAGLSIMIPPVKCDPAAWSRIECNGRWDFEVISRWQMANAGSGSAELGAVWLITPPADTNTATGSVCRLPCSLSFHQTCSHCLPSLFLFCLITCNSWLKSKRTLSRAPNK